MADVFMSFIKYASIILLAVKGTVDVGGWHNVFEKNLDTERLQVFEAMWVNLAGVVVLQTVLCYVGLVIFARYSDCDPISVKEVTAADQVTHLYA
ncbi:hypothetical protein V5799_001013 [Amblyomma americanum]|uniref:Uncharacterized protein n=1 Tax=Amblyomma americanum TaxID=6943 RepID=A0AAQ4D1E0_AMBAM